MATKKPLSAKEGIQLEEKSGAVTYNEQNEGMVYNNQDTELRAQINGADREIVTDTETQTLTSKTIDADLNTISNIGTSEISDDSIDKDKISADVAGLGLGQNVDGSLEVNVDDSTVEIATDTLQVKALGIDTAQLAADSVDKTKLAADVAGLGITQAVGGELDVNVDDSTIEIATDTVQIKALGVDTAQIAADAVDKDKIAADVAGIGLGQNIDGSLEVNVDDTGIEISTDTLQLKDGGVATAKLANDSVDKDKIAADVAGLGLGQNVDGSLEVNVDDSTIEISTDTIQVKDAGISDAKVATGIDAAKLADGSVSNTELQYINSLDSNAQDQIDGKADTTGTAENTFTIGDNLDTNKVLEFDNGDANNPAIRYNASGNELEFANDGATWQAFGSGSGGGGLDTFYTEDFETTLIGSIDSGNNATFLGGGSIAGTLVYETTNPIAGTQSLKLTQAAGSLNDYVALPAITLDDKEKGNSIGFNHYFTYDGDAGDIEVIVWDVTNAVQLVANVSGEQTKYYTNKGNPTRFTIQVYPPTTATTLRVGFQVKVANSGAILVVDDFEGSSNPFVSQNLYNEIVFSAKIANSGTPSITSQSSPNNPAIASVAVGGSAGFSTITFTPGFFSVAPSVAVVCEEAEKKGTAYNITTSGCSVLTEINGTTNGVADYNITMVRQSTDYKFESPAIIHSSTGTENDFTAVIPSSGTSVTSEGANAISSLSWSVNTATVNLNAGQFTVAPRIDIFPEPVSYTVSNTTITATFSAPVEFNLNISSQGVDYKNPNAYAVTQQTTETVQIVDGITAPATASFAQMYIDSADGDLKIKFADGTVKTITTDT